MKIDVDNSRRAQRRQITILFSDLSGSTALAGSVEPEEYADLLAELKHCFDRVISRHGGSITQCRGDGILATFGLEAREDEARRATEAALELHQAVKDIAVNSRLLEYSRPTLHSGIHSSQVLVAEGSAIDGRHVVIGEAANLAARLSDEASADEILVSEASLGADLNFFTAGQRRSLSLKGIDAPLAVYPVLGHSEVNTRFEARRLRGLAPMVGRQRELNLLRNAFDACTQRGLQKVSIVAMPGMGKTRLAEEFLQELAISHCIVLRGYCESYLNAEPLQPVLQMLRQLLDLDHPGLARRVDQSLNEHLTAIDASLSSHLPTFEALLSPSQGTKRPRERAFIDAITDLLGSVTRSRSAILFVDDWQWVDDTTRRVFAAIGQLADKPLLIVTASRERLSPNSSASVTTINLDPLALDQGARIIQSLIPLADPFLIARIQRGSGGNPLFLEELSHAAARTGSAERSPRYAPNESQQIPNYLKMLIESRVAHLSAEQAYLVRAAAAIGNVVPLWLLEAVTGVTEKNGLLKTLTDVDLIFPGETDGTLRFKHGITRDVIVDAVGLHERRELHLTIARTLENRYTGSAREDFLETLAYHYGETTSFEQAAQYAEAAGDKAMVAAALDRARLQYQAAIKALNQLDQSDHVYRRWMAVAQRLFMACLYDAKRDQRDTYVRAVMLATQRGDYAGIANAEYSLAYINYCLGEAADAIANCERARDALSHVNDDPLAVQIIATLAQTRAMAGEYEAALPAFDAALTIQRKYRSKTRAAAPLAYSLAAKAMVLGDLGQFDAAFACFDEADDAIQGFDHTIQISIACMRSGAYIWQGSWDAALEYTQKTVELADRIGSRYMSAMATAIGGYATWHLSGENDHAEDLVNGTAWIETQDHALWTSMNYGWLCEVMATLGRYAEVRHYAARALMRARKREHLGETAAYCALAAIPPGPFCKRSSEYYFARARASADRRGSRREHAVISLNEAEVKGRHGHAAAAIDTLRACRDEFSGMRMYWHASKAQKLEREFS